MNEDLIRLLTQVCISSALLLAGLSVLVLETGDAATQKLAAGCFRWLPSRELRHRNR